MRRRYTPELFLKVARRWREIRPDGGLTTDIIVGFPGETAEDFEESLRIASEARFSAIHVFPYSPRVGTVAADLPDHVPPHEQNRRVDALLALARALSAEYAEQFIGRMQPVLIEEVDEQHGMAEGLIPQYVKARVELHPSAAMNIGVGDIIWMEIHSWRDGALEGKQRNTSA
jgi:threonylcarbamoyladenosine tRNA methylthiotransferase MtaB